EIPPFTDETVAALRQVLPPFTSAQNPVDATGVGLALQASAARPVSCSLEAVAHDPNIDFVLYTGMNLPASAPPDPEPVERRLDQQAELIRTSPIPVLSATMTCSDIGDFARSLLLPRGVWLLPGLDLALSAIGHALRWQKCRSQ